MVLGRDVFTAKVPTTPEDQSLGVLDAIDRALEAAGALPADVDAFAHGMTVATNALLEGVHARTAFVATEGFTDIVELGRQARADLYRLCVAHPPPMTPAERRFAAPERLGGRLHSLPAPAVASRSARDELLENEVIRPTIELFDEVDIALVGFRPTSRRACCWPRGAAGSNSGWPNQARCWRPEERS